MKSTVDRSILMRFLGITLVNALLFFSSQFFGTTLPIYLHDLSGSDSIVGICTALGTIAALIIRPIAGVAVDRIGRAPILLAGSLFMVLTFASYSIFHSVTAAIVIRFLYGFGTGALLPSVNSLLTKMAPKEGLARIFAYNQTFTYMGSVLGPIFGSSVAAYLGYPWVFYMTAGLVLINLIWSLMIFRNYVKVKEIV